MNRDIINDLGYKMSHLFFRVLLIIGFSTLMIACGPQYKIVHDYVPPENPLGLSCIQQQCANNQKVCQLECNDVFEMCMQRQEHQARADFPHLMEKYHAQMDTYHAEKALYNERYENYRLKLELLQDRQKFSLNTCRQQRVAKKHCRSYHQYQREINDMTRPTRPYQPSKPSLKRNIRQAQRQCSRDCRCDKMFNKCYVGCGGKVNSRKVCIKNC